MALVNVLGTDGSVVGQQELPENIFGVEVRQHLLYAMVRYQRAKARAGTHKVKERAEVRGGGRKPWRQKGTGRARQGTTRAPHWRGGGVVFGPRVRSHAFKLNKSVRRAALLAALSLRAQSGDLVVLQNLSLEAPKTRLAAAALQAVGAPNALLVLERGAESAERASRNLPDVTVVWDDGVNVYDVLRRQKLVVTLDSLSAMVRRLEAK